MAGGTSESLNRLLDTISYFPGRAEEGYVVKYGTGKEGVSALAFYHSKDENPFLISTGKVMEGTECEIYPGCYPPSMATETDEGKEEISKRGNDIDIIASYTTQVPRNLESMGKAIISCYDPENEGFGYTVVLKVLAVAEMIPDKSFGYWRGEGLLEETSRLVATLQSPAFPVLIGKKMYDIYRGGTAFFVSDDMVEKWTSLPSVAGLRTKLRESIQMQEEGDTPIMSQDKLDDLQESIDSLDKYHMLSGDMMVEFMSPYRAILDKEMSPHLLFTALHGAFAMHQKLGVVHGFLRKGMVMSAPWVHDGYLCLGSIIGKYWVPNKGYIGVLSDVEHGLDKRSTKEEFQGILSTFGNDIGPEAIPWLFCYDAMTLCDDWGMKEIAEVFRRGLERNIRLWREGNEPDYDRYKEGVDTIARREGYLTEMIPVVDYFNISP